MQKLKAVMFFAVAVGAIGHRVKRIVNGNDAAPGQFPFQAWVMWSDGEWNYLLCGAVVIHENWILTTRNCLDDFNMDEYTMVLNDYNVFVAENEIIRKCVEIDMHDKSSIYMNDIALCRVDEPIPSQFIIEMAEKGGSFVGEDCTISGWGATVEGGPYYISGVLQYTTGIIVDRKECQGHWESITGLHIVPLNTMFHCIHNENSGACYGDSGSPVTCGGKLVGVRHTGASNCDTSVPSVYMDITMPAYWSWINNIINRIPAPV